MREKTCFSFNVEMTLRLIKIGKLKNRELDDIEEISEIVEKLR